MEICAHLWFEINHKFTQIPTNFISLAPEDYSSPVYDFLKNFAAVILGFFFGGRLWADGADAQPLKTSIRFVIRAEVETSVGKYVTLGPYICSIN